MIPDMRMLEQILQNEDGPYCETTQLRRVLSETEVFLIDNVSEYLYAQTDQETWDVKTDFPCLAPPFPSFWMEHGRPSKIVSCEHGSLSAEHMAHRTGLWFDFSEVKVENIAKANQVQPALIQLAEALNMDFTPEVDQELKATLAAGADIFDMHDKRWDKLSIPAVLARSRMLQICFLNKIAKQGPEATFDMFNKIGVAWIGKCQAFIQPRRNGPIIGPLGEQTLALNSNGDVVETGSNVNLKIVKNLADWCKDGAGLSTAWFPGLLAISFTHCKNVITRTEETPAKLLKRQAERGKFHVTYKTLEITPMKAALKAAGAENPQTGLRRALHICRGHFANYREKGLFGKYVGRFWIPQHVRGAVESGVTLKQYAVNSRAK